jgi:hypothetical protein
MLPSVPGGRFKVRNHLSSKLLPLEPEIVSQKMWSQSQTTTFQTKNFVSMVQSNTVRGVERLRN